MAGPIANLIPDQVSRNVLRNLLLAFVVLDLVVLAAFSVRVDEVTRTTTTPAATIPSGIGAPTTPSLPAPVDAGVRLGNAGVSISEVAPLAPSASPSTTPAPTPAPTPALVEEPEPTPAEAARAQPCPIEIASSSTDGGLQSLIDFAPAFGPFKAEAFAAAAAYQPALQLIGPILAKYPALAPKLQSLLTPLLSSFERLLDVGFSLLGPLYAPHRQAFLEAEGELAAALAPYTQKLVGSPLGGCVIALQNALLHDTTA